MKNTLNKKFLGEDTLEEGRDALFKLEKQLKLRLNFDESEQHKSTTAGSGTTISVDLSVKDVEQSKNKTEDRSPEYVSLSPTTVAITPLAALNTLNSNLNGKYHTLFVLGHFRFSDSVGADSGYQKYLLGFSRF